MAEQQAAIAGLEATVEDRNSMVQRLTDRVMGLERYVAELESTAEQERVAEGGRERDVGKETERSKEDEEPAGR